LTRSSSRSKAANIITRDRPSTGRGGPDPLSSPTGCDHANLSNLRSPTRQKFGAQAILFLVVYLVEEIRIRTGCRDVRRTPAAHLEEAQMDAEKIEKQLAGSEDLRCQEIMRKANADAPAHHRGGPHGAARLTSQKATQQAIEDAENIIARAHEAVELDRTKMVAESEEGNAPPRGGHHSEGRRENPHHPGSGASRRRNVEATRSLTIL